MPKHPLSSVEAFALALVEASSRLDGAVSASGGEPVPHAGPRDDDGAPATE